jgi:hypothetical protein
MAKADYEARLASYITVNERIDAFYAKYPEGSLQSEIVTHTPKIVVVKAMAFRTADDPRPGIGHSMMMIPGTTPYTEDSEVENAETSAWGRALAALGFEVKKGIATRQEIENKETKSDKSHTPANGKEPNPGGGDGEPVSVNQLQLLDISGERKLGTGYSKWLEKRLGELRTTRATLSKPHFQMLVNEIADYGRDDGTQEPPPEEDPFA